MTVVCTTSLEAYEVARKLVDEYDKRKFKDKEMNIRKEAASKKKAASAVPGPSRMVTEIDYNKHEQTVKELKRQEEEEAFNIKKVEASQWCTLDHEHGPHCRRMVPGCSHDHQKEWAIYEKSTAEKIKASDRFKQEGNEAYRKCNYGLASVHYRKALLQFDYTFAEGEEEEKQVEDVKLPCLLNLAACKCQQEEWDEVLTHCRLALEINPRSVKAFYRTGLAHMARDKFDLAKDALTSAHEIEPRNPDVIASLKQLKKNIDNYGRRQREVYKEMVDPVNRPEEEEPTPTGLGEEETAATSSEAIAAAASPSPAAAAEADEVASVSGGGGSSGSAVASAKVEAPSPIATLTAGAANKGTAVAEDDGGTVEDCSGEASGVRRRLGGVKAAAAASHDDDDEDEDDLSPVQSRALNLVLLAAFLLAFFSFLIWAASSHL